MSVRPKTPISSSKFTPGWFCFCLSHSHCTHCHPNYTHLLTLKPQELLFGIGVTVITNNNPNIVSVAEKRMLQLPCIGNPASWVQIQLLRHSSAYNSCALAVFQVETCQEVAVTLSLAGCVSIFFVI